MKWYVQAELVHARFAMAGVAGILLTDVSHHHIIYTFFFLFILNIFLVILFKLLRVTRIRDLPVWYEAGATKFNFASTTTLLIIQLLLMGYNVNTMLILDNLYLSLIFCIYRFVETKRYMDFLHPGSQAKPGSFFGLEAALEGLEPG